MNSYAKYEELFYEWKELGAKIASIGSIVQNCCPASREQIDDCCVLFKDIQDRLNTLYKETLQAVENNEEVRKDDKV